MPVNLLQDIDKERRTLEQSINEVTVLLTGELSLTENAKCRSRLWPTSCTPTLQRGYRFRVIRVLFADQQRLLHPGIQSILSGTNGLRLIDIVTCIDELKKCCDKYQPDVLLLGLDVVEPSQFATLFEKLQQSCSGVPILVLVDSTNEAHLHSLEIQHITGIISKTDTPEELVEAIKAVAAGKNWVSRSLVPVLRSLRRYNVVNLTRREIEVLRLVSKEMTDKEIAITLGISPRTVRFHLENIYIKLGTTTRTGAVAKAIQCHLI